MWILWTFLVLLVIGGLVVYAVRGRGSGSTPIASEPRPEPAPGDGDVGRDIAVAAFRRTIDAERVYARVRGEHAGAPWLQDVAFVERRHHDHIAIRGVFAGRYLDFDDLRQVSPALSTEIGEALEDDGSALLIFAAEDEVNTMAGTLEDEDARVVRHHLSPVASAELRASVGAAPPAAPAP